MSQRLNRHAEMRRHKRKQKKQYGYGLYTGYRTNTRLMEDEYRERYGDYPNSRNGGYEYWQRYYLTGPRKYAKSCTNRAIRAMYRDLFNSLERECDSIDQQFWGQDIQALSGSDYEKMYDYMWTIW